MPISTYDKELSKSVTIYTYELNSLTSQCKRGLNEKLSSRNFSSGLKPKGLRHSQDREYGALITSCGQNNARGIGNFKYGHRKQPKMQTIVGATKSGVYKKHFMNKQHPHATVESEKKKIQTEKDKLGNHHNDPDRVPSKIWYKGLWREFKRQARKVANSNADSDSSSDESMSDEKQKIFHKSPKKSIKICALERLSNSSRWNKLIDFKNVSREKVSYSKTVPAIYAVLPFSSPKQLKNAVVDKRTFDSYGTRRPSDSTGNNFEKFFVSDENFAFQSSKGVEVNYESQKGDKYDKVELPVHASMILESNCVYIHPRIPEASSYASIPNQDRDATKLTPEETLSTISDDCDRDATRLTPEETLSTISDDCDRDATRLTPEETLSTISDDCDIDATSLTPVVTLPTLSDGWDRGNEENEDALVHENNYVVLQEKINVTSGSRFYAFKQTLRWGGVAKLDRGNEENEDALVRENNYFVLQEKMNVVPEDVRMKFINRSKSLHFEDSLAYLKLLVGIITASKKTEKKPVEMNVVPEDVRMKFINRSKSLHFEDSLAYLKLLVGIITASKKTEKKPVEYINAKAGLRCKHELTVIKIYSSIIQNETCRLMISVDMVVSKANHLFGLERTKILFDLLDEELLHFESPGASSEFVPNMAEYAVRQHVISFFEHAGDIMNIFMKLLSCCPDSKILQEKTEKEFISLMQHVIDFSLPKAKINKGAKSSLKVTKGIKLIMVASDEFVRAMGGEIPEDVLYRHHQGEEMIVHRLDDTRHQPSNRRENRPIHSIYFPSDCRLFIYIPTENGSYWHQSDMQRASRIHNNNSSNLSSNCNPHGHQVQ